MCPCAQQQAESLMDGPAYTQNLTPSAGGFNNTLADTAGDYWARVKAGELPATDNPWAIDGKAPWSRGERLVAAVGGGILVGTLAVVMIRKPRKRK